jgi:putative spermidine/putrescine transport system substrate-binding protein
MSSPFLKHRIVRLLLIGLVMLAFVVSVTGIRVRADNPTVLDVYIDGDTNISDWWLKTIVPAFTKKYPQYQVQISITRGAGDNDRIAQRAVAAMQTGADPQVDYFEEYETFNHPDVQKTGLFLELNETNVPNLKNVPQKAFRGKYDLPYRFSQVLIAYNSEKIPESEVPHTFADLVKWIKAHPGQFVYCRPDKGGSGGNFVTRAIYEANGRDPSLFKAGQFDEAKVKPLYEKGWALLRDIHPSIYDNGSYPAGNIASLLLLANESVSMISAWSDQSIQAIENGTLPANTKLVQLSDLPFPGGYAYGSIPKNAKHLDGSLLLANFVLSEEVQTSVLKEIGGFPAISWDLLPKELKQKYAAVITDNVPEWPGGQFSNLRNDGWYANVATNIDPKAP